MNDANGPLIAGPVTPVEFASELRVTARNVREQGEVSKGEDLEHLAEEIRGAAAVGGDVQPLLARARLILGYADEDAELLHAVGWGIDATEAARMLGVEADAVREMIRTNQVVVVRLLGSVLLPRLQFAAEGEGFRLLPGVAQVVAAAVEAGAEGWHLLQWLTLPTSSLDGQQPIDVLRAGEIEPVLAAVRAEV